MTYDTEERFTASALCDRAARAWWATAAVEIGDGGLSSCRIRRGGEAGVFIATFGYVGGERRVLLQGTANSLRVVAMIEACTGGPGGGGGCSTSEVRLHRRTFGDVHVLAFETVAETYDLDMGLGEGTLWRRRNLTVCRHTGTSRDLHCAARVPLESVTEDLEVRTRSRARPRVIARTRQLGVAVLRPDGATRLHMREGDIASLFTAAVPGLPAPYAVPEVATTTEASFAWNP